MRRDGSDRSFSRPTARWEVLYGLQATLVHRRVDLGITVWTTVAGEEKEREEEEVEEVEVVEEEEEEEEEERDASSSSSSSSPEPEEDRDSRYSRDSLKLDRPAAVVEVAMGASIPVNCFAFITPAPPSAINFASGVKFTMWTRPCCVPTATKKGYCSTGWHWKHVSCGMGRDRERRNALARGGRGG